MKEQIWIEQPALAGKLNAEAQEDFTLLMSLRLDDLLDAEEEQRFQGYVSQHAQCAQQWRRWQQLHHRFAHAPHMEPPLDFARQFATRLDAQERRRQLWWGAAVGALFMLLWLGMVIGTVAFGLILVMNQPVWMSNLIHNLAYLGATIQQGVALWWNSFNSFLATPQAQGMGIAYLLVAIALLMLWVRVLRRTTRIEEIVSMI
jgi:hypothetical protein